MEKVNNVWFFNHYSQPIKYYPHERTFRYAEHLQSIGINSTIFCASTIHNTKVNLIEKNKPYIIEYDHNVKHIILKTRDYSGNGFKRILNMFDYVRGIKKIFKKLSKPNLIVATSVHPLACFIGIKVAKKLKIPCYIEIADLWPESFVAYGIVKKNNPLLRLLYLGEKWLYKKADKIFFTMEGGKDYIKDKKWDQQSGGPVNLNKVHHINNGVQLEAFVSNIEKFSFSDDDLDSSKFKVIYTGSIGRANNVLKIVETAQLIQKIDSNIMFIIYGVGEERGELEKYIIDNDIKNIKFKGVIEKIYIPYILSKSSVNIFHLSQNSILKYGVSLNKLFEYFASGKPILSDCESGYDIIKKYNAGIVVDQATPKQWADAIIKIKGLGEKEYTILCNNSLKAALDYDYKKLAARFEMIITGKEA